MRLEITFGMESAMTNLKATAVSKIVMFSPKRPLISSGRMEKESSDIELIPNTIIKMLKV